MGSSDKAKTMVTSDLQALGLMVTAEPYYAVTTPSDVVVLENVIRPDTVGRIEPVLAKYELLPRGQYTMTVNPDRLRTVEAAQEKLPYDRYEAVLELYQAQNAIQIARSVGADRYAADTIGKADSLLADAAGHGASQAGHAQDCVAGARSGADGGGRTNHRGEA